MAGQVSDTTLIKWACPWAKVDPQRWMMNHVCCYREPWDDLRSGIRHHAIGSHRTHNRKLLKEGHPDAISELLFEELDTWSARGKSWKTQDDKIARWYEVYNIIASWLQAATPADLYPEWDYDWVRKVLDEGKPVEAVHNILTSGNVREEAKLLVDRIKDKKASAERELMTLRNLRSTVLGFATRLETTITATEAQYRKELLELRTMLEEKVLFHESAHEFLAPFGPEIRALFPAEAHAAIPTVDPMSLPPIQDSAMTFDDTKPGSMSNTGSGLNGQPIINTVADSMHASRMESQHNPSMLSMEHLMQRPGTSAGSTEDQSTQNDMFYFGAQGPSTNTTFSDPQARNDTSSHTMEGMTYHEVFTKHDAGQQDIGDCPTEAPVTYLSFINLLADPDVEENFAFDEAFNNDLHHDR